MPTFIDRHDGLSLPQEVVQGLVADIKAGKRYDDGFKPVNAYANPQGTVFCVSDAANADIVKKHHESIGIPCGEVVEVQSLA